MFGDDSTEWLCIDACIYVYAVLLCVQIRAGVCVVKDKFREKN